MTTTDHLVRPTTALLRELPPFPDSVLRPRRARRRRRGRLAAVAVVLAGVAATSVAVVRSLDRVDGARYRTATVTRRAIDETLSGVATIEPVSRAVVAFPRAGVVSTVDVAVGDTVAIGDVLATVDTTELEQSLRQAQSALASAQLTLHVALDGDDPTAVTGGAEPGNAVQGVSAAMRSGTPVFEFVSAAVDAQRYTFVSASVSVSDVEAARAAVVAAQSAVMTATNTVAAQRDSAASICAAVDVTIDPNDPATSITSIGQALGACQSALADLLAAQDALTAAQAALDDAADALDSLLADWAADLAGQQTSTTTSTVPPSTSPSTTSPSSSTVPGSPTTTLPGAGTPTTGTTLPTGGGVGGGGPIGGTAGGGAVPSGSGSSSSTVAAEPTAEELIAYQADYDAAALAVEAATQAIAQATIASPIEGTVVSVGFEPGDAVAVASSTQAIVVQGPGGYEATLAVSVDDVGRIELGQSATLVPDGATTAMGGEVVGVSEVPDDTTSTASYRVTVGLAGDTSTLASGNIGDVSIVVRASADGVAVPTSAVTPDGAGATVDVVDDLGEVSSVTVQIGAVGPEWTEITSGLDVGQTVVVASLDEPLPSAATDVSDQTSQPGGQFPGGFTPPDGGFVPPSGGGGFPGAPPGG